MKKTRRMIIAVMMLFALAGCAEDTSGNGTGSSGTVGNSTAIAIQTEEATQEQTEAPVAGRNPSVYSTCEIFVNELIRVDEIPELCMCQSCAKSLHL